MAIVAQLVRASDCGSECRGFESRRSPFFYLAGNFVSTLEAIFLGIVQGLTEFLPISSSGHLMLIQNLLGMNNLKEYIIFDMVCHLGTLLAIFFVFFDQIKSILFGDRQVLLKLFVAILPLFPLLLLLKPIKSLFNEPQYLGYFFLLTAFILYTGVRFGRNKPSSLVDHPIKDALTIGLFQAGAILPGVSRSGSTITAARLLGWSYSDAITFSFLLAIPTILGGVVLEIAQIIFKQEVTHTDLSLIQYISGFITSFLFGWASLLFLQRLATKHNFMYFVWYCLLLGIGTILYFGI